MTTLKLGTCIHLRTTFAPTCRVGWLVSKDPLAFQVATLGGVEVIQPGAVEAPTGPNTFHNAATCPEAL